MLRATESQLRDRIARKRAARQSTAREEIALQDAIHARLRAELEEAEAERIEQLRGRREPGSYQREGLFDE